MVVSVHMLLVFFFFFKQKTAYEMRISDWSSDVCSSDLHGRQYHCAALARSADARAAACLAARRPALVRGSTGGPGNRSRSDSRSAAHDRRCHRLVGAGGAVAI